MSALAVAAVIVGTGVVILGALVLLGSRIGKNF